MIWHFIFWISFFARLLLTVIDLYETRKLDVLPLQRRTRNDQRLYGLNKIRQLPLLAAALLSSLFIGGFYLLLAPVLTIAFIFFAQAARQAQNQFVMGEIHYPRLNIVVQIIEVGLCGWIAIDYFSRQGTL
ncbi:hypothetical protein [Agrobacterium cavarae]|uniref:hypothetical protein n=1 Tax=Agrobacterium cavarae TaxID=2528239 RepID=UPI003EE53B7E